MTSEKWGRRFIQMAELVATWSKDRSTKVGAVIIGPNREILSVGYNGFPRGCDDTIDARHERPEKYAWSEHCERNAIFNAARRGISLEGSIIALTWFPCVDCTRAIIQCGIKEIICNHPADFPEQFDRWKDSFEKSMEIIKDSGITLTLWHKVDNIEDKVDNHPAPKNQCAALPVGDS